MKASTGYRRAPRRQSAALRVAESPKPVATPKAEYTRHYIKGRITLLVKGKASITKNYDSKKSRRQIIGKWIEEFGTITYTISPQ